MAQRPDLVDLDGLFYGVLDPEVGRPFVIEVTKGDGGRFNLIGLYFSPVLSSEPLPNESLRKVSVSRLEAAVVRDRAISHGYQILAEMELASEGKVPPPRKERSQTLEGAIRKFADQLESEREDRPRRKPLRVPMPKEKRFPDSFYQRLAEAYLDAIALGYSPVTALADANDRPPKTVAAWVRETRRRGFLPPGRAGKAG